MEQLSFSDRILELFKLIFSSPFFISLFIILLLTIFLLVINIKANNKLLKKISIIIYIGLTLFLIIKYWGSLTTLSNELLDKVFTAIYFPNFISYICMLIISVLFFIMTMINNKVSKVFKITNIAAFIILTFLFILTIDIISNNNIDIYDKVSIYSNNTLIILIQSSMGIFALWLIILAVDTFVNYLIKKDNKNKIDVHMKNEALNVVIENDKITTLSDDDFTVLSEDNFYSSYSKYEKKKQYEDYMKILENEES